MIRDAIFATLFWIVLGFAGYTIAGPIEGLALWRLFAIVGLSGFAHGYLTARARHDAELESVASALRAASTLGPVEFDIDSDVDDAIMQLGELTLDPDFRTQERDDLARAGFPGELEP